MSRREAPKAAKRVAPALVQSGEVPQLFLDANILLPQYLRAVFLDLAAAGVIRVHWTSEILVEVRRNLVSQRKVFGLSDAAAD